LFIKGGKLDVPFLEGRWGVKGEGPSLDGPRGVLVLRRQQWFGCFYYFVICFSSLNDWHVLAKVDVLFSNKFFRN
jgi:hypothetical protein